MEIPRYVQLDFLSVLVGLSFFAGSLYIFISRVPASVLPQTLYLVLIIGTIGGLPLFLFGFTEMQRNYEKEQELKELEREIQILELKKQKKEFEKRA